MQTDFLVLRKIPYSETSLVVAGLSNTQGHLRFMVRGARKISGKKMPVVDIFRLIHVKYAAGKNDLHTWRDGELIANYGDVARDLGLCETAAWLARFTLTHSLEGVDCQHFFLALKTGLNRLAERAREKAYSAGRHTAEQGPATYSKTDSAGLEKNDALSFAVKSGLILVYLSENGLLPDYPAGSPEDHQLKILLASAMNKSPLPSLNAAKWREIFGWGQTLLNDHVEPYEPKNE